MSYSRDDYPEIFDKSAYEFPVTMLRLMARRLVTKFDIPAPCKHNLILTTPLPTQEYYSFLNLHIVPRNNSKHNSHWLEVTRK